MPPVATIPSTAAEHRLHLRSAGALIEARLRDDADAEGLPAPHVGVLGFDDMLGRAIVTPWHPFPAPAVHLTVRSVLIGPGESARAGDPCGHCVALRWQKVRSEQERTVLEEGRAVHDVALSPYLTAFALDAISRLYSATRATADPAVSGIAAVFELALATLAVRAYAVLADPDCPACSGRGDDGPDTARLTLVSRPKDDPDRLRLRSVADYDLAAPALANPVCGALGAGATTLLDCPTTAPVSGHLLVRSYHRLLDLGWSGHGDAFADSTATALLEGLERYAGSRQRRFVRTVVDSYDRLAPDALDPRDCGVYADEVYRDPSPFVRFAPDKPIPWVWGYSLRDERPVLVPERIVYYMGRVAEDNFVHECSNGCAGGSCIEEAILYGMLELIERDAFLLAWFGRARLPEIDVDSIGDRGIRCMVDRIRLNGYDVRLFDNRVDLPVPVVTGVAVRRDGGLGTLCFAAGAGFDPVAAVRSALCEIASYIPSLPARVASRLSEIERMTTDFSLVTELPDHAVLFGHPDMARHTDFLLAERPTTPFAEIYRDWLAERPRNLDLLDDLKYCRNLLVDAGFDVIVVDQTAPEQERFGLRSVCVVVPGLLPVDFGWHKQRALHMPRLRTAFRRAGWRTTPLRDDDLHRVPHPFP